VVLKVLIVEDDAADCQALVQLMQSQGLEASGAETLAEARARLQDDAFELVLLDIQLPDGSGTDLLPELEERETDVVMVSGQSTLDDAIAALRRGALDFLQKPIDVPRLTAIVENLRRRAALRDQVRSLRGQLRELGRFGDLVGASPAMQRVYECIERVAPTNETVMIMGESGSGKEVTAATIQRLSRRRDQPFVTVNCGAISATLIESELFGHERGAFTGADRRRKGLFEQADRGTLFLDEVTEMPIDLQVRLLRVLETGRLTRVGGQEEIEVDVRIIAASNRDPERAVADGKLRHDLLYRLLVFPIHLPPLRERAGDVELLAEYFLDKLNAEYKTTRPLLPATLRRLAKHDWPGNVRELYNTLRRAYIMAGDEITPEDLMLGCDGQPVDASGPGAGDEGGAGGCAEPMPGKAGTAATTATIHAGMTIAEAERLLIEATLTQTAGNKKEAAASLGISLKTLYARLQVYAAQSR